MRDYYITYRYGNRLQYQGTITVSGRSKIDAINGLVDILYAEREYPWRLVAVRMV